MSEQKWTAGKWKFNKNKMQVIADDPRATIVAGITGARSNVDAVADGHLIAAAPALYEALKKAFGHMSSGRDADEAYAALAQAEGKT